MRKGFREGQVIEKKIKTERLVATALRQRIVSNNAPFLLIYSKSLCKEQVFVFFFLNPMKSQSSFQTPNDQLSRQIKSAQYKNPEYAIERENEGSFMYKSTLRITEMSRELCRTLLEKEQTVSQNTLFRDDLFDETCRKIQDRNETIGHSKYRFADCFFFPLRHWRFTVPLTLIISTKQLTKAGIAYLFFFPLHKTRPQLGFFCGIRAIRIHSRTTR